MSVLVSIISIQMNWPFVFLGRKRRGKTGDIVRGYWGDEEGWLPDHLLGRPSEGFDDPLVQPSAAELVVERVSRHGPWTHRHQLDADGAGDAAVDSEGIGDRSSHAMQGGRRSHVGRRRGHLHSDVSYGRKKADVKGRLNVNNYFRVR